MSMHITIKKKPSGSSALVFFLFLDTKIETHDLYAFLTKEEKRYMEQVRKSLQVKEKEARVLLLPSGRKAILIGFGERKTFSDAKAGMAMRIAIQTARKERIARFAFRAYPMPTSVHTENFYETVAINAAMANFEFTSYRTPPPEGFFFVQEIEMLCEKASQAMQGGIKSGLIIGEEINACRTLANTPSSDMTPERLASHARAIAKGLKVEVEVLDEKKMAKLGMGGVLGVGQGSNQPPRFIAMRYSGGAKKEKPVVLVGKGVTFDSGGLNLKPSNAIYEMHMDMSGGAAVIHTLIAAARLKLKRNIVALVPAVENMVSGNSYHPGDVLRTMSGKTIEVLDTDAEGRIILADALEYAKRYDPALIVDVATLTGAVMVALGQRYSGLFTPEKAWEEIFRSMGEETGDEVWPLPLSAAYEDEIRGTFGDWANVGKVRLGGATQAAVFLWQFAKGYPWVHLDIASRMTSIDGEYLAKGAAGSPIRLLVRLLERVDIR